MLEEYKELIKLKGELKAASMKIKELEQKMSTAAPVESDGERLTYDYCFGGDHCWEIRGADNQICADVCKEQDEGCADCPIKKAIDRLAYYEELEEKGKLFILGKIFEINMYGEIKYMFLHIDEDTGCLMGYANSKRESTEAERFKIFGDVAQC